MPSKKVGIEPFFIKIFRYTQVPAKGKVLRNSIFVIDGFQERKIASSIVNFYINVEREKG